MLKEGISFTMGMIVSALVIISTGVIVLGIVNPAMADTRDQVDDTSSRNIDQIDAEVNRGKCEQLMDQYCGKSATEGCPVAGDQSWACVARVDGQPCYSYWEGSYTIIPACESATGQNGQAGPVSTGFLGIGTARMGSGAETTASFVSKGSDSSTVSAMLQQGDDKQVLEILFVPMLYEGLVDQIDGKDARLPFAIHRSRKEDVLDRLAKFLNEKTSGGGVFGGEDAEIESVEEFKEEVAAIKEDGSEVAIDLVHGLDVFEGYAYATKTILTRANFFSQKDTAAFADEEIDINLATPEKFYQQTGGDTALPDACIDLFTGMSPLAPVPFSEGEGLIWRDEVFLGYSWEELGLAAERALAMEKDRWFAMAKTESVRQAGRTFDQLLQECRSAWEDAVGAQYDIVMAICNNRDGVELETSQGKDKRSLCRHIVDNPSQNAGDESNEDFGIAYKTGKGRSLVYMGPLTDNGQAGTNAFSAHELGHVLGLSHVKAGCGAALPPDSAEYVNEADTENFSNETKSKFLMSYCLDQLFFGPAASEYLHDLVESSLRE